MHFIPAYIDKLSKGQLTFMEKRMQKYSKQTQYYMHTFNPKAGHSLSFFVKFPKVSEYFEQILRNHMWNQHRQGLYNGMLELTIRRSTSQFHKSSSETRTSMKCLNSQMSTSCYNNSANVTVNCNLTSTMMSTL